MEQRGWTHLRDSSRNSPAQAFWLFVSRIDLIEETSRITFPGIPDSMKSVWGDDFFFDRDEGRNIRSSSCGAGTPQGILQNSTEEQRIDACKDLLGTPH